MHHKHTKNPEAGNHLLRLYISGFILSIVLTLAAFFIVNIHVTTHHFELSHEFIITTILCLAVAQLFVQLYFFLHMGQEKKPRWNLAVFISFISVILIIVIASIWIMYHLNYNMNPIQMQNYLIQQEGLQK